MSKKELVVLEAQCKYCPSTHLVKFGLIPTVGQGKRQRYRCQDCAKTQYIEDKKRRKLMQAVELGIKTKRVVYRGEKCYKILDFSCYNIEDDRLPHSYFAEFPYCFEDDGKLVVIVGNTNSYQYEIGDYVDKDEFEKNLKVIQYCGEKLHNINQGIKQMRLEWQGIEEFKI